MVLFVWHLIISLILKNELFDSTQLWMFCRPLNQVTLSLVMDEPHIPSFPLIKCQNRVIKLSRDCFSASCSEPHDRASEAKRIKLAAGSEDEEEESFAGGQSSERECVQAVTAVTSLSPLLAFGQVRCIALLQIREDESDNSSEHRFFPCGRLFLSLEDLSSGKHLVTFPKKPIGNFFVGTFESYTTLNQNIVRTLLYLAILMKKACDVFFL